MPPKNQNKTKSKTKTKNKQRKKPRKCTSLMTTDDDNEEKLSFRCGRKTHVIRYRDYNVAPLQRPPSKKEKASDESGVVYARKTLDDPETSYQLMKSVGRHLHVHVHVHVHVPAELPEQQIPPGLDTK